jgi:hypothetical protein
MGPFARREGIKPGVGRKSSAKKIRTKPGQTVCSPTGSNLSSKFRRQTRLFSRVENRSENLDKTGGREENFDRFAAEVP